jgi:protein-S-isoprenylcysteine O-methyltransferase Ste14
MTVPQPTSTLGRRLRRVAVVETTRTLPLGAFIAVMPALHDFACGLVLGLYAIWAAAESFVEDPNTNRQAVDSVDDRGTRRLILGAHLLALFVPFVEHVFWSTTYPVAWTAAGSLLFVVGASLRLAAVFALGPFFTAHVRTTPTQTICRRGLYGIVRHPSYTGLFILNLSISIMLCAPYSILAVALTSGLAICARVNVEEATLAAAFQEQYLDYQRSTPRYWPRFAGSGRR